MPQLFAEYDLACVLLEPAAESARALIDVALEAHHRGRRVAIVVPKHDAHGENATYAQENGLAVYPVDALLSSSAMRIGRALQTLFQTVKVRVVHLDCGAQQHCPRAWLFALRFSSSARLVLGDHARSGLAERLTHAAAPPLKPLPDEDTLRRNLAVYDALAPLPESVVPSVGTAASSHIVGGGVFARNLLANWLAVTADVVVAFFLTPLILSSLTLVVYGVWSLINSIVGYMGLVDLGIRGSVGRYVNHYLARNDHQRVNQVIATSLFFLTAVALLALLASYFIAANFDVFFRRTPPELLDELLIVLPLMAVNLWLLFVMAVFRNVLESFDRFEISNGIGLAVLALRTAGVVYVLGAGYGFVGLAIVTVATSALSVIAHYIAARLLYRPLSLAPRFVSKERFIEMWRFGVASFIARSASHVIYQTDQIVVMIFFGPAMVGIYSIATLLVQNGQRLIDQVGSTLFPSVMKAGSLQDRAGLARVYLFQARVGLFMAVLLYVGYIVFGAQFIDLWMGNGFEAAFSVLIILSIAEIAAVMSSNGGAVLFSLDKIRPNLIMAGSQAGINLILSVALAAWSGLGMAGVALATLISMVVMQGVIHPWYTSRHIGLTYRDYLLGVGVRTGFIAVASFLLFHLVNVWFFENNTWFGFLLNVALASSLYLIIAIPIQFRRAEIGVVLGHVPLVRRWIHGRPGQ